MTNDRLDELETFRLEDDTPLDARISLPWRDLRDLVALIPVVRAAMRMADEPADVFHRASGAERDLYSTLDDLRREPERDEL